MHCRPLWRVPSDRNTKRSRAGPGNAPNSSRGRDTSMTWSACSRRWRVVGRNLAPDVSLPAAMPDEPTVARGALRAWLAPGVDLAAIIAADGNADRLLTRIECRIVKLQR